MMKSEFPHDGGNLTFEVTVGEITSSSIAYTVTPSDLKAEYLCILADAKTVESFTRDEFLVEAILEELKAEAGAQGKTLAEYMPEIVDKGLSPMASSRICPRRPNTTSSCSE